MPIPLSRLPLVKGKKVVKAFERLGWTQDRQEGSHIILIKEGCVATLSVPDHKEVAKGTLKGILEASGEDLDAFLAEI